MLHSERVRFEIDDLRMLRLNMGKHSCEYAVSTKRLLAQLSRIIKRVSVV